MVSSLSLSNNLTTLSVISSISSGSFREETKIILPKLSTSWKLPYRGDQALSSHKDFLSLLKFTTQMVSEAGGVTPSSEKGIAISISQ